MNPEMQKELLSRLDTLAAKLGTTAGFLWQVLLHQARVEAIENTVIAAVCLACLILIYARFNRLKNWVAEGSSYDERFMVWIPIGLIAAAAFITLIVVSCCAFTEWMSPGYFALEEILDKLK